MRKDIIERKPEILEWIELHKSKAFMASQLKCKVDTLDSYLKKFGIDYKGNQGDRGSQSPSYIPASGYFSGEKTIKSHALKLKLIRDGIKEHKCEICNLEDWMGQPIPIELDHIDGDHYNNSLDNLRILCPNCHAQTPTNSGRNKKRYH